MHGDVIQIARNEDSNHSFTFSDSVETIVKKPRLEISNPVAEFKLSSNEFQPQPAFWKSQIQPATRKETLDLESLFQVPPPAQTKQNNDTFETLEIVNNLNKKILISVPRRPASYNFESLNIKGTPTLEELYQRLPNPFDYIVRNDAFTKGNYRLDYQSGYAPEDLQSKYKDPEDYTKKNHFIRQKQTQANLNLKRTCGVSYVKQSESQQHNVSHIFKRLPPLVYQCSSGCQVLEDWDEQLDNLFNHLLNGKSVMVCSLFQSPDEQILRDYLLNPADRNKIAKEKAILLKKLYNLWMFCQDSLCLVIHLHYDQYVHIITRKQLLKTLSIDPDIPLQQQLVDFIANSQIQICLLFKKSVSGRKAFLKSVGLWNDQPDALSVTTNSTSEQDADHVSTKFVIQLPRLPITHTTTAESIFQQFTAILGKEYHPEQSSAKVEKQQKREKPAKVEKGEKPKMKQQQKKGKKRVKQIDGSDIRQNSGASQALVDFLTKEDGFNNINTCSIRMEMYVDENKWENANKMNKDLLNSFIKRVEHHIQSGLLIIMMNKRFKAFDKGIDYITKKASKIKEVSTAGFTAQVNEQISWTVDIKKEGLEHLSSQRLPSQLPKANLDILKLPKDQGKKELTYLQSPLYCITTRDSFAYDLITKSSKVKLGERLVDRYLLILARHDFYFDPSNCPSNFKGNFLENFPEYQVGCHTYINYFTNEELLQIEKDIYEMELKAFDGHYLPMTAQISFAQSNHQTSVRRTKFFFGYRYMWTKCQLAEPHSMVAAGVRRDVSSPPEWMNRLIAKLEADKVIPQSFVNSIACNVYHDGKEGLAQHFDDAVRFKQPIFTIRVFSDCRLSFGSQFYGFCNGAFAVPLPRGCICVMEEGSYAANAIKHCVRPCDMTGKSAALILRQMHDQVTQEAIRYDEQVDLPCHLSTLSIKEDAVPFGEQKRLEAEINMK